MTPPVLQVEGLTLAVGGAALVEDVSFVIAPGEMLALVGESGCGKSVTALAIMRLLAPAIRRTEGSIRMDGTELSTLDDEAMRRLRGNRMAMIFQEPMTSLNPVFTVGEQIAEVLRLHRGLSNRAALVRAAELLDLVGLPTPVRQLARYPHQMSGGQRQRVMIAIALACEPRLLVADEPTTALDVTVQAQILALIDRLRRQLEMACLLITHDLGVVAEYCDRAAVMYAGRIVETGPAAEVFARPLHRYTSALVRTMPARNPPGEVLPAIAGQVPPPGARGAGCSFAPRCAAPVVACAARPALDGGVHAVACWNPVS